MEDNKSLRENPSPEELKNLQNNWQKRFCKNNWETSYCKIELKDGTVIYDGKKIFEGKLWMN